MIIQNKKDGHQESVSREQWERIKAIGFAGMWNVISNDDIEKPKKVIPKEILTFKEMIHPKTKKNGTKRSGTVPGDKDV